MPDYDYLRSLFAEELVRQGTTNDFIYDWRLKATVSLPVIANPSAPKSQIDTIWILSADPCGSTHMHCRARELLAHVEPCQLITG